MTKKSFYFFLLTIVSVLPLYSGGQVESGRDSAIALVDSDSYIGSSYIDLDAILDNYYYPYEINTEESITFKIDSSINSVISLGSTVNIQVALKTNKYKFFDTIDFNYIIYINDLDIVEDNEYQAALNKGLESILSTKTHNSKIFVYLKDDKNIVEIKSIEQIASIVELLPEKTSKNISNYFKEAKRDLENLLLAMPDNEMPNKFFWIFEKKIADSKKDINDIFGTISGLGGYTTEISFCGNSKNFRASTVNTIVEQFGGNSYYFQDPDDIRDLIEKDYNFYQKPAISNLKVVIYNLCNNAPQIIKEISIESMGADEYHTFLAEINVPPISGYKLRGTLNGEEERKLPISAVLIEYYDNKLMKYRYSSKIIEVEYTSYFHEQVDSMDYYIRRNSEIKNTYRIISEISKQLQYNRYYDALVKLEEQIEMLEFINYEYNDELIFEDINLLKKYKRLIYENRDNPLKVFKAFSELTTKGY